MGRRQGALPYISRPGWSRDGAMEFSNMSMPSFPPDGANLTREEALTMIIASIAMEELALSHILNAEGEKLQYILGTLPGTKPCAGPREVLAVNRSVTALLEAVTQNQMLLKNKLERALEACPPPAPPCGAEPCPCPCPPPCAPETCEKSALQLTGRQTGQLWNRGCRFPWRQLVRRGTDLHWSEQFPGKVCLNAEKAYTVQYTLNISAAHPANGPGIIFLKQTPPGTFTDILPLHFQPEGCTGRPRTLQYTAVLYPCAGRRSEAELSLILESPNALCVERAVMNITEL